MSQVPPKPRHPLGVMRALSLARGLFFLAAAALLPLPASGQAGSGDPHPGDGKLYIGTYTSIVVIDEATATVEDQIFLESGIPRTMVLSENRERFYVMNTMYEDIEVIDIAQRRSLARHNLSSGNRKIRFSSFQVDPSERYLIALVRSFDRLLDRYEVSRPYLIRYDLESRLVTDTIPWPGGEVRQNARILFAPDGETVYFFADQVLVLETEGFTEVDRWQYQDALDENFGSFEFGFPSQLFDEPGYFTGLFRVTEGVQRQRQMGIARVNLAERDIEYFTLGPNEGVSFTLAPGGTRGYGLLQQTTVGQYEFWTFDLEQRRVSQRGSFPGRPRMSLMPSSTGEVLYIYNAGNTIDLHDASTYRYLQTIDLNVDSSTTLFVLPAPGSQAEAPNSGRATNADEG